MRPATLLKLRDGHETGFRSWGPPAARDTFLLLHGLVSHSGTFERLGGRTEARELPLRLVSFDRRGAGLSKGTRGDVGIAGLSEIVDDVVYVARTLAEGAGRLHLVSWCAGVGIAARAMDQLSDLVSSLCHLAPMIRGAESEFLVGSAMRFGAAAQSASFDTLVDSPDYWHDSGFGADYTNDELMTRRLTPRLAFAYFQAGQDVPELLAKVRVPQIALIGLADKLIAPDKSEELLLRCGIPREFIRRIDEAPHAIWEAREDVVLDTFTELAALS